MKALLHHYLFCEQGFASGHSFIGIAPFQNPIRGVAIGITS